MKRIVFSEVKCKPGEIYITDLKHIAFRVDMDFSPNGDIIVTYPDDCCIALHFNLVVPDFGRVWVTADNNGEGYNSKTNKDFLLIEELVRSRISRCHRRISDVSVKGHVEDLLDSAVELLDKFRKTKSSENKKSLWQALKEAIIAGEEIELEIAREALKNRDWRRIPAPIISTTFFGERLGKYCIGVGKDWDMEKEHPDFLRPRKEWELMAKIYNGTTLPNFWRWIEPIRGKYCWEPLDEIVEFSSRHNIKVKSFAIYWGGIGGTPPWFRTLKFDEQKKAIEKWTLALVGRYKGEIHTWETCNEMHDWEFANKFKWSHEQIIDVTHLVNEIVGSIDTGTPRIINHCCPWGEYVQTADWEPRKGMWGPLSYLKEIIGRSIPFEGIGMQMYNPGRDMMDISSHLDRFTNSGKPVWITEMGIPSDYRGYKVETDQIDPTAGWRNPWSQEVQADWVEYFYTIAISKSFVKSLNYWDFDDEMSFIPNAGMLNYDGIPKLCYYKLDKLLRKMR